ncbi:MAG: ABC transporter permease [Acidobacteria bacterium]|jgi:putative ABC transport system permease protein|nr:ABC transporter permease [Acidobacteriota bacterium]
MSRLRFVLAMAWREGRASRRRGLLLIAAVAVGVAALVAINSFTDSLGQSIRAEARALLGADLVVSSYQAFGDDTEALLEELRRAAGPGPGARVARTITFGAMARVPNGGATRLVQVRAVDPGYPFYGSIETTPAGEWSRLAETGEAIADPSLPIALGIEIGDQFALGEATFILRATVDDFPGDVGVRSSLGPRVFIGRDRVDDTGLLAFGSRAGHRAYLALPPGADPQQLAERFRPRFGEQRVNLRTVEDNQRRLGDAMEHLGDYLGLVALAALLLGGLGVASAVHVFIKRRMESVAILRCLGVSGATLLAVYLVQAVAVGLLGSLLGAALGAVVQLELPRVLSDVLPVDVAWAPSWPAILGGIGVGVWVAVVFSLLPLLAVRRVSPLMVLRRDYEGERIGRDPARLVAVLALAASVVALAVLQAGDVRSGLGFATGVGVAVGALWVAAALLVRGLRRFFPSALPYLYRQGLANLYRPANQTLMVVLALGFGAFLLATLLLVQHNLLRELRVDQGAQRPNVVFFDVQPDQRDEVEALVAETAPLIGDPTPIVPMRLHSVKGRLVTAVLGASDADGVRGRWALRREYRSSYRDTPNPSDEIVEGAWWQPGEWRGRGTDQELPVAIEAEVAGELGVGLGDPIVWDIQGVRVASRVACLREVNWARFEPNFFVLFPEGPLESAPQSFVLLARVEQPDARARMQREVIDLYPNVSSLDLTQVQRAIESILDRVVLAVRFMALFSLVAGAIVLVGAVAASRYQRVREGALLRTLGATRPQLLRILLAEYAVLGALAGVTAIALSTLAGFILVRFVFEGRFAVPGPSMLALVLTVMVMTVTIGLSGSTEVWRRPPLEVLRAE